MQRLILILVCSVLIFSCRKDSVYVEDNSNNLTDSLDTLEAPIYDTIFPGEYWPAYPLTYWNYTNYNGDNVNWVIDSIYHLYDGAYHPLFLTANKYVKFDKILQYQYHGLGASTISESPIYAEAPEANHWEAICQVSFVTFEFVQFTGDPQMSPWRRTFVNIDTTITNLNNDTYDNVLVMKEYMTSDNTHRYFDYFALGVGLVKRDSVDVADTNNLIEILTLDSYNIGPH